MINLFLTALILISVGYTAVSFVSSGYLDLNGTINRWIDAVSLPIDTTGIVFNTTAFWPYYFPSMIALVITCLGVVYWDEWKCRHR